MNQKMKCKNTSFVYHIVNGIIVFISLIILLIFISFLDYSVNRFILNQEDAVLSIEKKGEIIALICASFCLSVGVVLERIFRGKNDYMEIQDNQLLINRSKNEIVIAYQDITKTESVYEYLDKPFKQKRLKIFTGSDTEKRIYTLINGKAEIINKLYEYLNLKIANEECSDEEILKLLKEQNMLL